MGTTTSNALPYPEATGRVMDGHADLQALAEAVDDQLPRVWVGNVTTDASGYATVTHGAGWTPRAVLVQLATTAAISAYASWGVDTLTATTLRVRAIKSDGTVAGAATVPLHVWLYPPVAV